MMNNISMLLPKNTRQVWSSQLESLEDDFDNDPSAFVEIPLLGKITAGKPIERIED